MFDDLGILRGFGSQIKSRLPCGARYLRPPKNPINRLQPNASSLFYSFFSLPQISPLFLVNPRDFLGFVAQLALSYCYYFRAFLICSSFLYLDSRVSISLCCITRIKIQSPSISIRERTIRGSGTFTLDVMPSDSDSFFFFLFFLSSFC